MAEVKVYIIDDSAFIRDLLKERLSRDSGIKVVGVAAGPRVAADEIIDLEPDVITLDVEMPDMNGIEFLKTIKTHQGLKKIPVVVLTTSMADQDINASFELGAAGYMVKPLDYKEFIDAVATIARYWQLSELPE